MKKFKLFYLERCPYCLQARKYMEELLQENPQYQKLDLQMIEERQEEALANSFDYYYVPSFFYNNEKLFEGAMTKEDVQHVFDTVLQRDSQEN